MVGGYVTLKKILSTNELPAHEKRMEERLTDLEEIVKRLVKENEEMKKELQELKAHSGKSKK